MKIRQADHNDEQDLLSFLGEIDSSFDPPLRVRVEIGQWLKKVLTLGKVLVSGEQQKINGAVAFYCNDRENLQAFITFLGVAGQSRGMGIGRRLLEGSVSIARHEGMKSVLVTTWAENRAAITLYEAHGFKKDEAESRRSEKIALRLVL